MTSYTRGDYGPNPHAGADRNNAAERGWGLGWPNCQYSKMVVIRKAGVAVSVRKEIAELVATLFQATEEKFNYDIKAGQTWGMACRPIRGTQTASNHSWGLAVDINSLANPMQSTFKSDIPPPVVHMWEACGFYWGGRYSNRPDAMHFEYIFRPEDVARHLTKAKTYLSTQKPDSPKPPIEEETMNILSKYGASQYVLIDVTYPFVQKISVGTLNALGKMPGYKYHLLTNAEINMLIDLQKLREERERAVIWMETFVRRDGEKNPALQELADILTEVREMAAGSPRALVEMPDLRIAQLPDPEPDEDDDNI